MSDITNSVPYINIILIGETGSGKSSLVNTFATALENRNTIMSICSSSPAVSSIGSVTTQVIQYKCHDLYILIILKNCMVEWNVYLWVDKTFGETIFFLIYKLRPLFFIQLFNKIYFTTSFNARSVIACFDICSSYLCVFNII